MAIRRKRITLTNVLSQMDTRVRATELRQIKVGATNAVEAGTPSPSDIGIGTVVSDNAPCHFRKIVGGKYYSKRVTGDVDRVELYLTSDTDASSSDTILVSGISLPYIVSGNYVVSAINPAGQDRPSWLSPLPSGVTSSILYSAGQDVQESDPIVLTTKSKVASHSTNGTVTHGVIVFTATHGFRVGDVVDTSELTSPYDGLDGMFKVTAVTSNSITYKFTADLADPINSSVPTTDTYVYSVVQKKVSVGDTWIDSSTTPSTTHYWDGLRWTLSRSAATTGTSDTLAPANVSNIQSTTSAYTIDGGIARSRVTLTWDAPTKNSDDSNLTDLAGYEVWANYTGFSGPWTEKTGILSANTSTILSNLNQNVTVYFKIFAIDSSLNRSPGADYSTTTGIFALELAPPTAPTLTTRLGTVTVSWNGLQKNPDTTESNPPTSIRLVEVHASTTSGFTPSTGTLKATMAAGSANYTVVSGLDYGSTWYFKLVAVDVNGNKTSGSVQTLTTISKAVGNDITANTITTNNLDVGNVGAGLVSANVLKATNPAGTSGFEINANYLRAFSATLGNTFMVNGTTGVVTVGSNTVISGNSITTGTINAANVTIANLSANAITTGTLNAANVTVTNLSANAITSGTMSGVTTRFIDTAGSLVGYIFQAPDDAGEPSIYMSYQGAGTPDKSASNIIKITNGQFYARGGSGNSSTISLVASSAYISSGGANSDITLASTGLDSTINLNATTVKINGVAIGGGSGGRIRIPSTLVSDASYSSTDHPVQIGSDGFPNLRIDNNEVLAVSAAGGASALHLNIDGGSVHMGYGYNSGSPTNTLPGLGIDYTNDYVYANGVYGQTLTTTYRSVYVSAAGSGGTPAFPQNRLGYVASSRRFKKNIEPLQYTAEQVLQVEPVQYNYITEEDTDSKHAGFIAEQLHDLGLTGYLSYGEGNQPDTVQYEFYVSALQTVVRHQATQIQELKDRVSALESK